MAKLPARARRLLAYAALATVGFNSAATPVFVSTEADGSAKYATQRLDASYVLLSPAPVSSPVVRPRAVGKLNELIDPIARRHGLDPLLVRAIVSVESNHHPQAVSPKGAVGAMQLMPRTAADYGVSGKALLNPSANLDVGARHLKALLQRYRGNVALALAAYNSGEGSVRRHGNRIPPYQETMLYVPAVLANAAQPSQD